MQEMNDMDWVDYSCSNTPCGFLAAWCSHEPPKKLNFCSLCDSGLAALTVQRMLILVSSEQQWFCGILFMMGKCNLGRSDRNENY